MLFNNDNLSENRRFDQLSTVLNHIISALKLNSRTTRKSGDIYLLKQSTALRNKG